jgi:hypothetical protein
MRAHYHTEQEIRDVVAGFESCTTGKDDFSHRSHLTVAVWYLRNSTPEDAFHKMCAGLCRFLDHHAIGRSVYNEPLTRAWIEVVQEVIETNRELSLVELTNLVVKRLGKSRIVLDDQGECRVLRNDSSPSTP